MWDARLVLGSRDTLPPHAISTSATRRTLHAIDSSCRRNSRRCCIGALGVRVLITGKGTSGSWQIRGVQLGQALGASVVPNARDLSSYDLAVLVKRQTSDLLQRVHRSKVPVIWDVVDAWPQPVGNAWQKEQCLSWLAAEVKTIRPAGIVAATRAMAQDCEGFGVPVLALPHHARPGLRQNPIRPLKVLGYEGGEKYLGRWLPIIQRQCSARGLRFVINPAEVADVDVLVALRDCDGYAPRNWKSNVKLANAQGSGTPVICNREAGYLETACGAEQWADDEAEFAAALDALESVEVRHSAARVLRAAAPDIDTVAATYLEWLQSKFQIFKGPSIAVVKTAKRRWGMWGA